jgi:hypothetical protein
LNFKFGIFLFAFFMPVLAFSQGESLFIQEGTASYYATKFQGRRTASGEVFHLDSLTAAHKLLPFGTILRVTNQKNGKSVQVKDNSILLMQGSQELGRFDLQNSMYLKDQQNTNRLLNLMAGVGAAWALHLPMSTIEVGVNSFAQEEMEA